MPKPPNNTGEKNIDESLLSESQESGTLRTAPDQGQQTFESTGKSNIDSLMAASRASFEGARTAAMTNEGQIQIRNLEEIPMTSTDPTVQAYLEKRAATAEPIPVAAILAEAPSEMLDVRDEIVKISGNWNCVEFYTPEFKFQSREDEEEGLDTEKKLFFQAFERGEVYNPQFTYTRAEGLDTRDPRKRLNELLRALDGVSTTSKGALWFGRGLREKLLDDLATCDLIDGLAGRSHDGLTGDALSKRALVQKYWQLDADLLAHAEADFRMRTQPREPGPSGKLGDREQKYLQSREFKADETRRAFEWALSQYGLLQSTDNPRGFPVIVTNKATAIDVRHRSEKGKAIVVPTDENRTEALTALDAYYLVAHEIEAHARQAENGFLLLGVMGGEMACDDESMYEALAMFYENRCIQEHFGRVELRPYPYQYPTAVAIAQRGGSFHDVFMDQFARYWRTEQTNPLWPEVPRKDQVSEKAWNKAMKAAYRTTYRVMRGHRDTTNREGFAMAKDLAYERGYLIQRELERLGLGHVNEAAIMTRDGLMRMAELDLKPEDLPHKNKRIAEVFLQQLLNDMPN